MFWYLIYSYHNNRISCTVIESGIYILILEYTMHGSRGGPTLTVFFVLFFAVFS